MNLYTIDFETHPIINGHNYSPVPVGVSIKLNNNPSHYYAWGHPQNNNCSKDKAAQILGEIWDSGNKIICHNSKFDLRIALEHFGLPVPDPSRIIDTMIMMYLIDPRESSLSLKPLTEKYCGMPPEEQDQLNKWLISHKFKPGQDICRAPGDLVGTYAESDTDRTYVLYHTLAPRIFIPKTDQQNIHDAFKREMRILPIVIDMEKRGINIAENIEDIYTKENNAFQLMDMQIMAYSNGTKPGSMDMFYALQKRGMIDMSKVQYTEKTGKPRIGKEFIEDIISDTNLSYLLKNRSKKQKLVGTYIKPFYESAKIYKNKFYPYYNQTRSEGDFGTRTGRFCIARDSMVQLLGKSVPIQDVKPGDLVYSFDDNLQLCAKRVLSTLHTGVKEVVRIHWQVNGSSIPVSGYLDCTPDHRIRLIDGTYVEAQNLSINTPLDRTLSVRREVGAYGNNRLFSTRDKFNGIKECLIIEELLNGPLKSNELVHHIDNDKTNDDPSNLLRMKSTHHTKLHGMKLTIEDEIELLKNYNINIDFIVNCDGELCEITIPDLIEALHRCGGKSLEASRALNITAYTLRTLCEQCSINIRKFRSQYLPDCRLITKDLVLEAVELCKKHNADHAGYLFLGIGHQRFKELQEQYGLKPFINGNHIITKIEWLNVSTDVYDLEIEDTHNFIANEICVHNSSNIQQLPKHNLEEDELHARSVIVPSPGKIFIRRDFSGQELRVAAHYAEGAILKKYQDEPKTDIHAFVSAIIKEKTGLEVSRFFVKIINFLKLYGGGPDAMSRKHNVSLETARAFFRAYDEALPEFKQLMKDIEKLSKSGKKIRTWGGRSYDVEEAKDGRQFYYKLGNVLIQGSSADITKEAMVRYWYNPGRKGDLLMTVHDELVVECDPTDVKTEMAILKWAMDEIPGLDCPLVSDGSTGYNFSDLEDYIDG